MVEPINLNKARKARDKAAAKAQAAENRVKHGRTKGQKVLAALEAERAKRGLNGARRED